MQSSPPHLHQPRLLLALTTLALVQIACFTSRKTVIIRAGGSGEVRAEAAVPQALGAALDRVETERSLAADGWTNISFAADHAGDPACTLTTEEQTAAISAFEALMPVFTHPNCANCHGGVTDPYLPGTDHPGEMLAAGQTCDECHLEAAETGPGSWRLAPPELAFAGRTAEQICAQVKSFHNSPNGFIGHMEGDPLIGFGFLGTSAGAADAPHPIGIPRGEALSLATAWRDALGLGAGARFWPGGQESLCGCGLVEPVPIVSSGVLDVVAADYPFQAFGPEVAAAAVNEFSSVAYSAETREDGSTVHTFNAVADLSELQEAWDEVLEVWTVEGLVLEGGGEDIIDQLIAGTAVFTPEEVRAMIDAYGQPRIEVVVVLPGDFTQAAAGWANSGDLLSGATDSARFTWIPGDPVVTELSAVRVERPPGQGGVGEQRELDPDSIFEFSMQLHWNVPVLDASTPGQVAGAAQGGHAPPSAETQLATLRLLDAARRSTDPAVHTQLDGFAYAPVQLSGLEHKAVVVFPSGTDWRTTGVVLDPWVAAYPAGVPVGDWAGSVWAGQGPVGPEVDPALGGLYPHSGGGPATYPPDVQRDDARPRPAAGTYPRSLFARGPVSVLVVLPDGRHIGETAAGGFINHLRGEAEMFKRAGGLGTFDWWTFLPETGYRVEIYAQTAGALHVVVGGAGFDIDDLRTGEKLVFTVSPDGTPGPVTRSGGEQVPPVGMDPDTLPAPAEPAAGPVLLDGRAWLTAGFACMVVLGLALVVVSGIGLSRRERRP